jgi:hypothetical protein
MTPFVHRHLLAAASLALLTATSTNAQTQRNRSLFTGFDDEIHSVKGDWEIIADQVRITDGKMALAELPGTVSGSYRLITEFTRTSGTNSIGFIVPVGSRQCIINLAVFDGEAHGIATVDGRFARDNVTTIRPGTLENGQRYKLIVDATVDGDSAAIRSQLNGQPFLKWNGSPSSLALLDFWKLPRANSIGLFANCSVIFHSLTVGPIAGEISSLNPNPKPMMSGPKSGTTPASSVTETVPFAGQQWRTGNAEQVTVENYLGRPALHVVGKEAAFIPIADARFGDGVIEVDIASSTFSGIGFRGNPAGTVVEKVYFRPQNSGTAKHANTVQYSMLGRPKFGWRALRESFPGKYESGADIDVNEWFHVRVEIQGQQASVYVNGSSKPVFVVDQLLGDRADGTIGVWGWNSYFSDFSLTPASKLQ